MAHITSSEFSYCTEAKEFDALTSGGDEGPTTMCRWCREPEPTWEEVSLEEFDRIAKV